MADHDEYYLVKSDILPEVFVKVMAVKRLLNSGKAVSVNEAVKQAGLSRSAYYKYKDSIMPFYETSKGKIVTLIIAVENFPGILSGIIQCIAFAKGNILTINQNIPINGLADVSVSMETDRMNKSIDLLLADVGKIPGVRSCRIMARE
ncbi:MAG: ACT domain-containing protein [Clostridiaceae bacterium]|jgi:chorismate mutase|nr:ACT domain-containing protein [Oscillospiraceae bacterium]NLO62222.1 ACT domain-containing protein [Clostridiaceae bacterium]